MEDPEGGRRESTKYSPGGAEEKTGGWRVLEGVSFSLSMTSIGVRLPTCGLVLGEVTLLREEGSGQHLNSNPPSFYPRPKNSEPQTPVPCWGPASQQDRIPDTPTPPPTFKALRFLYPLPFAFSPPPIPGFPPLAPNPAHLPSAGPHHLDCSALRDLFLQ